jgi:hypothetical protein
MAEIGFDDAAEELGIKRHLLDRIVKEGKEITYHKHGNSNVVNRTDLDNYKAIKEARKVYLDKNEFLEALKFALKINLQGHTRQDFEKNRQRPFMQAVENWTQGALAELALRKFIVNRYKVELQIEFRVFEDAIVGQDIVGVKRNKVINPPAKKVSVKSGKLNGMVLIVPVKEVENPQRLSDYYAFVRIDFPVDTFVRFYREAPEFADVKEMILPFENAVAYIVGYCERAELVKRTVPEAGITDELRYVLEAGNLKNSDTDWQIFVNSL